MIWRADGDGSQKSGGAAGTGELGTVQNDGPAGKEDEPGIVRQTGGRDPHKDLIGLEHEGKSFTLFV